MKFQSLIPLLSLTCTILAQEKAVNNMFAAMSGITYAMKEAEKAVDKFDENLDEGPKALSSLFPKVTWALRHGVERVEDVASLATTDSNRLIDSAISIAYHAASMADALDYRRPKLVAGEMRACTGAWLYEELQGARGLVTSFTRKAPSQHRVSYQSIGGALIRTFQNITNVYGGNSGHPTACGMMNYPWVSSIVGI
jgi:hypothetical protein